MPWFPVGFPLSHSIGIIFPSLWLRHSKALTGDWQKTYQLWDHDLFELSLLCQMAEEKWQLAAGNICIPLKLQEVAIFQEVFQDFSGFFRSYSSICRWFSEGKSVPGQGARKPQNRLFLIRHMFVDGADSYLCIYISLYIESGFDPFISRYKWHICWVMFPIIK